MPRKTDAEIFAERIEQRFRTGEELLAAQQAVMCIIEKTSEAIGDDVKDWGMIADAMSVIAEEAKNLHDEAIAHHMEQQAAVSHGMETRELWQDWRNKVAHDTMLIKELRDVYFKLSPEMLADHLSVAEPLTIAKGLSALKKGDPDSYERVKLAIKESE